MKIKDLKKIMILAIILNLILFIVSIITKKYLDIIIAITNIIIVYSIYKMLKKVENEK